MQQSFLFGDKPKEPGAFSTQRVEYDFPTSPEGWNGLALVGEAPGAEETRLGHPFVGRSGQLLDKTLEKAGIDRRRSLVANVFRIQPPGNKVDHFFISRRAAKQQGVEIAEEFGSFGSAFCRAEFASEIQYLRATLEKMKKDYAGMVVVALGRTPLWALTGESGLLQKVGQSLSCRFLPGTKVIPTFHPSFILRGNWALQDDWLRHFVSIKKYFQ